MKLDPIKEASSSIAKLSSASCPKRAGGDARSVRNYERRKAFADLEEEFNIEELVEWLLKISENTHYLISYGKNSLNVIKKLNDPCKNALKLEKFWSRTINDNKV